MKYLRYKIILNYFFGHPGKSLKPNGHTQLQALDFLYSKTVEMKAAVVAEWASVCHIQVDFHQNPGLNPPRGYKYDPYFLVPKSIRFKYML